MITPQYEYCKDNDVHRQVHEYLIDVRFLPKPLGRCFYDEIQKMNNDFLDASSNVAWIHKHAHPHDVVNAIDKATKLDVEVLFVMFVGHGSPDGRMLLQDRRSMTRQALHKIVRGFKFIGTLIDVYCMCHAQGPEYTPFGDTAIARPLSELEKVNAPMVSIYSSTYFSQKYSNGLAFLRRFRRIVFGNKAFPKYAEVTTEALTPTPDEVASAHKDLDAAKEATLHEMLAEWDDCDTLKSAELPLVHVCGHDISEALIREALGDRRMFDPLPADLIPATIER